MRTRSLTRFCLTVTASGLFALGAHPPALAQDSSSPCDSPPEGVSCSQGNGRHTAGGAGTGNVSHKGWPGITGVLMQADDEGRTMTGGRLNDELLGGHGDDHAIGGQGSDVLWGDQHPTGNTTKQHDVLDGGGGADWIYPSHGSNVIRGGAGTDHIIAFYGHGTIDCGPGRDFAQVRTNGAYTLHGCEHVSHFCQFGSSPDGRCLSPSGKPVGPAPKSAALRTPGG